MHQQKQLTQIWLRNTSVKILKDIMIIVPDYIRILLLSRPFSIPISLLRSQMTDLLS